jgi:hypothetical protein
MNSVTDKGGIGNPAQYDAGTTLHASSRSDDMMVAGRIYPPVWVLGRAGVAERRLNELAGVGFNRRSATNRIVVAGSMG